MALGAKSSQVWQMVVKDGLLLAVLGAALVSAARLRSLV
jgi:hypothetical protein